MSSKRRLRLRVTLMAGIEYVATCTFLGVYWLLARAEGSIVVGFLAYSMIANVLILGGIATGWSERLADPSMTAIQMGVSCGRDLAGCLLMPNLWFIFVFNLFIALPFGSLQFSNRAFMWFWLLTCSGLGLIFFNYPDRLQIGFDTRQEKLLLWAFISAALARLMLFNSRISALRRNLRAKAAQLDQVGRRLEREKISRDLHDTLLQATYGLIWRFAGIVQQLSEVNPVRAKLEAALDSAEQALKAAREEVFGLREAVHASHPLAETLQQAGEQLALESDILFVVTASDEQLPLSENVRVDLERILREALLNAFRHSEGKCVTLELQFLAQEFTALVRDDGRGITSGERQAQAGHLGLSNMTERAASIGARLAVTAAATGGTLVSVRVPASLAYDRTKLAKRGWLERIGYRRD